MRLLVPSFRAFVVVAFAALLVTHSRAIGLNDTGQMLGNDSTDTAVGCGPAVGGDTRFNPRQDARYGRDAAASTDQLSEIGAGNVNLRCGSTYGVRRLTSRWTLSRSENLNTAFW